MKLRIKECKVAKDKPVVAFRVYLADADKAKAYECKDLTGYTIEISKPHRSDNVNRYMWALIRQIAEQAGLSDITIYRQHVREAGVYYDGSIATDEYQQFADDWADKGIGWWVEPDLQGEHFTSFRAYRGSSSYNSVEMKRLVDNVIADCEFYGIETRTPDEVAKMLQMWGA